MKIDVLKYLLISAFLGLSLPLSAFDLEAIEAASEGQLSSIRDSRTGLVQEHHSLAQDRHRMRFNAQMFPNPKKASEVVGAAAKYAHRINSAWWAEGSLYYYKADSVRITDLDPESVVNGNLMADGQITMMGAALGLSLRGRLAQNFLGDRWFETISALLSYSSMNESTLDETFAGPGLMVDYSLHNRMGQNYFWGINGQYAVSQMKRAEEFEGERSSARTLTTYWYTLGVELGFYF